MSPALAHLVAAAFLLSPALAQVPPPASGLEITPTPLDFGAVVTGHTGDRDLTVRNNGTASLTVSSVEFSSTLFRTVSPSIPFSVTPGATQAITIRFAPSQTGAVSGSLTVVSSDPLRPVVQVPLLGLGTGASGVDSPQISLRTARLDFGSVPMGNSREAQVTIGNSGSAGLVVKSVSTDNPVYSVAGVTLPLTVAAGAQAVVTVRFAPTAAGVVSGTLSVASNDPATPTATISLTGTGTSTGTPGDGPAQISVSPGSIDFGAVIPTQTIDRTLAVSNTGGAPLTVTGITSNNARYSAIAPALPFTVAPGARQEVTVRFAPPGPGSQSGTLAIASNDAARPTVNVVVSGSGFSYDVLFSDSFDRPDADMCLAGPADHYQGGSGTVTYVPIFGIFNGTRLSPTGPELRNNGLQSWTRGLSGVEFTGLEDACSYSSASFQRFDIGIKVDVLVPTDADGNITQAGPFFRAKAVAPGDTILGNNGGGYWVQLHSTGEITLKLLNPESVVATTGKPASFDTRIMHTIEISAAGEVLQVALDGKLMVFRHGRVTTTSVPVPPLWEKETPPGVSHGAAGIAFGAETSQGQIGGQRLDNLVVSNGRPLGGLPVQSNFP